MDELCKAHDIAYAENKDSSKRYEADKDLAKGALKRVFSKDASLGERAASLFVTGAMKVKTGLSKLGLGVPDFCTRKMTKKGKKNTKKISFTALVKDARRGMKRSKATTIGTAITAAIRVAKQKRKGKHVKVPRLIKVPKITGGVLPLLPILAGLSAIGSLTGSAAGVYKIIRDIKQVNDFVAENKRHNQTIEKKLGDGLYLKTFKKGLGLYLKPHRTSGAGLYLKSFRGSKNSH